METTAVVPAQTVTGTKHSDNLYAPCTFQYLPRLLETADNTERYI
jgi:hypothetical protein